MVTKLYYLVHFSHDQDNKRSPSCKWMCTFPFTSCSIVILFPKIPTSKVVVHDVPTFCEARKDKDISTLISSNKNFHMVQHIN